MSNSPDTELVAETVYKLFTTRKVGDSHIPPDSIYQGPLRKWGKKEFDDAVSWMIRHGLLIDHAKSDGNVSLHPAKTPELLDFALQNLPDNRANRLENMLQSQRTEREERTLEAKDQEPYVTHKEMHESMGDLVPVNLFSDKMRQVNSRISDIATRLANIDQVGGNGGGKLTEEMAERISSLENRVGSLRKAVDNGQQEREGLWDEVDRIDTIERRLSTVENDLEAASAVVTRLLEMSKVREPSDTCDLCSEPAIQHPLLMIPDGNRWAPIGQGSVCELHKADICLAVNKEHRSALRGLAKKASDKWDRIVVGSSDTGESDQETSDMLMDYIKRFGATVVNFIHQEEEEVKAKAERDQTKAETVEVETVEVEVAEEVIPEPEDKDEQEGVIENLTNRQRQVYEMVLELADDKGIVPASDLYDLYSERLDITRAEASRNAAGRLSELKRIGLVTNPSYGTWQLSGQEEEPVTVAEANPQTLSQVTTNRLEEAWHCPECDDWSTDWYPSVHRHLNAIHDHTGPVDQFMEEVDEVEEIVAEVRTQVSSNRLDTPWQCPACEDFQSDWKPAIGKHKKDIHGVSGNQPVPVEQASEVQATQRTDNPRRLDEPFECPWCEDFESTWLPALSNHLRRHNATYQNGQAVLKEGLNGRKGNRLDKEWLCPVCEEWASDWYPNVVKHIRSHENIKLVDNKVVAL